MKRRIAWEDTVSSVGRNTVVNLKYMRNIMCKCKSRTLGFIGKNWNCTCTQKCCEASEFEGDGGKGFYISLRP